jgi:HK97 family phage prohead protease
MTEMIPEVKTMQNKFEKRNYTFEMRAEEQSDKGIIIGRAIVYDSRSNLGAFDEIIAQGALDKTDLKDVRFLVNHDLTKIPLARSRNNNENSTMQLMVDNEGLSVRINLDIENNTEARNLYSAIKRGDISGMSFMFSIAKGGDEWTDIKSEHPTRTIRNIAKIIEVSAVTIPAYEETNITARNKEALENARATLENVRQSLDSENNQALELEKLKILYLHN